VWLKVEVVDMLLKHTYDDKIQQGLCPRSTAGDGLVTPILCVPLFEKAVMDSDVGRLNWLVVPLFETEKIGPSGLANRIIRFYQF
jgi:hypothetical protein